MFEELLGSMGSGFSTGLGGGIASAVGGLFGGGKKGPSAAKLMAMQEKAQYRMAENLPMWQVVGLRNAGLNPILAATHGPASGQMPTSGAVDDRVVDLQAASARSQIANQTAQAKLYNAQAEKTEAETATELQRPENVSSDTAVKQGMLGVQQAEIARGWEQAGLAGATASLQRQLTSTEDWKTKKASTDYYFRELEYRLAKSNLGPRQTAELRKIAAEARLAETEAEVNESLREVEKQLGMAGKAAQILRGFRGGR